MQGLRPGLVGEPPAQRALVGGAEAHQVDEGRAPDALGVGGGGDGDAVEPARATAVGALDRKAGPALGHGGEPRLDLVGAEGHDLDLEPLLGLGLGGADALVEPVAQHAELQGVEELVDLVAVPLAHLELGDVGVERHVAPELGELAVVDHLAEVLAELVADLALHLVDPGDQLGERAELLDPLGGGLLAHARDVGEVVAGVAAQGGEVGILLGVRPYFSTTAAGSKRVMSLMPRRVISSVMRSFTSWRASRSPVTISTSISCRAARSASVAIRSSASKPASER